MSSSFPATWGTNVSKAPQLPSFTSYIAASCYNNQVQPKFWFNYQVTASDPLGIYTVRDGNSNIVNLEPAVLNPHQHATPDFTSAFGAPSIALTAVNGIEGSYTGQTWTLDYKPTANAPAVVVSSTVIPACVAPAPFNFQFLLFCSPDAFLPPGVVEINVEVDANGPVGDYEIRFADGTPLQFGTVMPLGITVPRNSGQFVIETSFGLATSQFPQTAQNELSFEGQTWSLVHVQTGQIVKTAVFPNCIVN